MKGIVKAVVAVALGLAVVAAPASAQMKKKAPAPAASSSSSSSSKITWNGGVGLTLPSTSGYDMGFNLRFGANFTPNGWPVWIRPEAAFDHLSVSCSGCGSMTAIGVSGDAGYNIKTTSNIGPYVMGGLNITHESFSVSGFSASATKLGINIGGGITFPFSGKKAYAEIRYVSAGGGLDYIPISVGLMF
jgi:hypothetical protein